MKVSSKRKLEKGGIARTLVWGNFQKEGGVDLWHKITRV